MCYFNVIVLSINLKSSNIYLLEEWRRKSFLESDLITEVQVPLFFMLGFWRLNRGILFTYKQQASYFSIKFKKSLNYKTSNNSHTEKVKTIWFAIDISIKIYMIQLTSVNVDADGDEEDGNETEVDDRVNQNRGAARVHTPELHHPVSSRNLKQKPRRQ